MKLSAFFLITLAIYVAFHAIAEVAPIFHLSKLILPILILIVLHGEELKFMIAFDFMMFTISFLIAIPVFDSIINMYIASFEIVGKQIGTTGLWAYFICVIYFSRAMNYVLAERVIKKKKIRERIGKMLP